MTASRDVANLHMSCPRCGLTVPLRASFLRLSRCPRCLATARVSVPMFVSERDGSAAADAVALGGLAIGVQPGPDEVVLALRGELDLASAPALERELDVAWRRGVGTVLVDLSELEFLDAAGLQVLLHGHRRFRERGHELRLRRGPRAVHKLFELTDAVGTFRFVD
ncbi:MAG TPA: STAS domain-containing protein [Solirubrobacteraceae bacterium]